MSFATEIVKSADGQYELCMSSEEFAVIDRVAREKFEASLY